MCGIAGYFTPRRRGAPGANLGAMTAMMTHRGPDGEGRWQSDDGHVALVFRRLAIIDLDGSPQPILGDGTAIVGNGEIYNYVELRKRFADYPYRTGGDIETVLAAKRAVGDGYVDVLNGMYGLALYDEREDTLELVRDRLGVKPLYWAELSGGGIVFASEIKPIFASGLVRPEIDQDAVNAYLAHGYVPGPATLFAGVRKLQPGHRLRIDSDGDIEEWAYWAPRPAADLPTNAEDIGAHLLSILEDSVRLQLRSDVPVGALLSGGIDSGMLVAMASRHTSRPMRTYTARFAGGRVDESPLAAAVAKRYGAEHTVLDVGAGNAEDELWKLAWYTEEPLNDAAVLPNFLIEQALGSHVRVTLNGTGGDELFAGYGRYFQLPVERRYRLLPRILRENIVTPLVGAVSPMRGWQLARGELWDTDRGAYLHAHSTHFPPPIREMAGNAMLSPPAAQSRHAKAFLTASPASDLQTAGLAGDIGSYLVDDLLTLLDRTAMAVSVEGRVPFLDHRLVEAALAVPASVRTPGEAQKGMLRRIASPLLPAEVLSAPKQGFVSPVPAWFQGAMGDAVRRILTSRETLDRGWWTRSGIEYLMANPNRHGYRVYTLLSLELAVRMFTGSSVQSSAPNARLRDIADAL